MGNLKCGISPKRLIVERNRRKFGTQGTTVHICRVLLMPDSWSLVWGHSVHFAKFPVPRFSKHYSFNSFHQISANCTQSDSWHCGILKFFLTQDMQIYYFQSAISPTIFIGVNQTFMTTLVTMVNLINAC